MRPSATRLLVWLCGVLIVGLALEWLVPSAPPPPPAAARLHGVTGIAAVLARDTAVWGGAILARPVFSISRRPPRAVAGSKSETAAGQARLSGIMITREGRRAIFAPDGGGRPMVLAEGATVNGVVINRILPDRVLLVGGHTLQPTYDHTRVTPPAFPQVQPNFQNPAFPNPNFPNPVFPGTGGAFPPGGFPVNPQPAGAAAQATDDGAQPPTPPPPFRGTLIPQRRE